jgi:hypothetical protein
MPLANRTTLIRRLKKALGIIREDPEQCEKKQEQNIPEPIDVNRLKKSPNLMRLKRIVSDETGRGIWGDKEVFNRLCNYLRAELSRPDIADSLYWDCNRIKTSMPHSSIFKH